MKKQYMAHKASAHLNDIRKINDFITGGWYYVPDLCVVLVRKTYLGDILIPYLTKDSTHDV